MTISQVLARRSIIANAGQQKGKQVVLGRRTLGMILPASVFYSASAIAGPPSGLASSRAQAQQLAADPQELVSSLRRDGVNLVTCGDEIGDAVKSLVANAQQQGPQNARRLTLASMQSGQGVWEVFYMPHIANVAKPLNLAVKPLRYIITDTRSADSTSGEVELELQTDVRIAAGITGMSPGVWLSTAGIVATSQANDTAVELDLTKFWVGGGCLPRPISDVFGSTSGLSSTTDTDRQVSSPNNKVNLLDSLVDWAGRAGFIKDFATFPVVFFDDDAGLCVFESPPLKSVIAAYRVSPTT